MRDANRGDARSQNEVGFFHTVSALRLDLLQGAAADEEVVAARWAEALRYLNGAAEKGKVDSQNSVGLIYAMGRSPSVEQDWVTAVKWWHKAADAGDATA